MSWKWLFLLVPILLIVSIPYVASTPLAKAYIVKLIEAETNVQIEIGRMQLSWRGPQTFSSLQFKGSDFNGSLETLKVGVPLWNLLDFLKLKHLSALKGDLNIENGAFQFPQAEVDQVSGFARVNNDAADFSFTGQANPTGSFSLQGQITHLSETIPDFSIHADLSSFPTEPLDQIASLKWGAAPGALIQIVGPSIQLNGTAERKDQTGSLDASILSPGAQAEIHAEFTGDILTLREPLLANITLTPQLSEWLLSDINPLFLTGIGAKNPIRIRIEPKGFRFPFHSKDVAIGRGTIDAGQIRCQNGGTLAAVIGILKNSRLSHVGEMNVWCTPMSFSLSRGILHTGRMDALVADSVHICTWGNIDLSRNRLDMILGLPADTLQQSFGITDISNNYVLKIPMTGKIGKPKLAATAAAVKIAALAAAQKGTRHGIVNLFTQPDADVPPPHLPFPWQ